MNKKIYVGIDVSRDTLEVVIHEDKQHRSFTNDQDGVGKILVMLKELSPELVVMEATGSYLC